MSTATPPGEDERDAWQVVQAHRARAARLLAGVGRDIERLDDEVTHRAQLQAEIRALTAEDRTGRRRAALLKRVSFQAHAARAACLAGELHKVIQMERQAWGLGAFELPAELSPQPVLPSQEQVDQEFAGIRAKVAAVMAAATGQEQPSPAAPSNGSPAAT